MWRGQAAEQTDPDFVQFETPAWGIRALARTLRTYQRLRRLTTLRQIVGRWAPPNENDTAAYLSFVCGACRAEPDETYDLNDPARMKALVEAIIRRETGAQPYADATIDEGLRLEAQT